MINSELALDRDGDTITLGIFTIRRADLPPRGGHERGVRVEVCREGRMVDWYRVRPWAGAWHVQRLPKGSPVPADAAEASAYAHILAAGLANHANRTGRP